MKEEFTFFWNGPLSQWEPSIFILDDIEYNCAEQYMMAEKARLFSDNESLDQIMEAENPATHQKLGRLIKSFDNDIWQEDEENGFPCCWNIVWRGNMAKYSQNSHLLKILMATKGTTLVEASPYDLIWGIGLKASDSRVNNRENWTGKNWLGKVLTSVRNFMEIDCRIYDNSINDERCPGE